MRRKLAANSRALPNIQRGESFSRRHWLEAAVGGTASLLVGGCQSSVQSEPPTGVAGSFTGQAGAGGQSSAAGGTAGMPSAAGGAGGMPSVGLGGSSGSLEGGPGGSGHQLDCKKEGFPPGCEPTRTDIEGPFYSPGAPQTMKINEGVAGDVLIVSGTVYGCDCKTPLTGAIVDVWQADSSGNYDNAGFTLRGQMLTNAQGQYEYESIIPGNYDNRPKHIHYKVSHPTGVPLTTQLYFEGDPLNATDPFIHESLIRPLTQQGNIYRVSFDIVLA